MKCDHDNIHQEEWYMKCKRCGKIWIEVWENEKVIAM